MKVIFNKKEQKQEEQPKNKETRFTRLISRLDLNDKGLDPEKRKSKWMVILAGIFVLYLLSFLFPSPKLLHHSLNAENKPMAKDSVLEGNTSNAQKSLTFEMPVDSFENALKKQIHESIPEKK